MNTYYQVLKKYADFSGRASRKEYWVFTLYNVVFIVIAVLLDNIFGIAMKEIGYGPLFGLYAIATLIPGLAVAVRRLHDVGKSGWLILISLIPLIGWVWLLVLMLTDSNQGENQYGVNPKDFEFADSFADEIVFLFIVFTFFSHAFWGIMPKIFDNFYQTNTCKIANKIMPLIYGVIPLFLAYVVKNKSKRILLIVLGILLLLYNLYLIVEQFIN